MRVLRWHALLFRTWLNTNSQPSPSGEKCRFEDDAVVTKAASKHEVGIIGRFIYNAKRAEWLHVECWDMEGAKMAWNQLREDHRIFPRAHANASAGQHQPCPALQSRHSMHQLLVSHSPPTDQDRLFLQLGTGCGASLTAAHHTLLPQSTGGAKAASMHPSAATRTHSQVFQLRESLEGTLWQHGEHVLCKVPASVAGTREIGGDFGTTRYLSHLANHNLGIPQFTASVNWLRRRHDSAFVTQTTNMRSAVSSIARGVVHLLHVECFNMEGTEMAQSCVSDTTIWRAASINSERTAGSVWGHSQRPLLTTSTSSILHAHHHFKHQPLFHHSPPKDQYISSGQPQRRWPAAAKGGMVTRVEHANILTVLEASWAPRSPRAGRWADFFQGTCECCRNARTGWHCEGTMVIARDPYITVAVHLLSQNEDEAPWGWQFRPRREAFPLAIHVECFNMEGTDTYAVVCLGLNQLREDHRICLGALGKGLHWPTSTSSILHAHHPEPPFQTPAPLLPFPADRSGRVIVSSGHPQRLKPAAAKDGMVACVDRPVATRTYAQSLKRREILEDTVG